MDNYPMLEIPTDLRVPGTYVQITSVPSATGLANMPRPMLIVAPYLGPDTSAVGAPGVDTLTHIASTADARGLGTYDGRNNPVLMQMVESAYAADPRVDLYVYPTQAGLNPWSATQAELGIELAVAPGRGGTLALYVGGVGGARLAFTVPVSADEDAAATALAALSHAVMDAINARPQLGIVAVDGGYVDDGQLTIRSIAKGVGVMPDIRVGYYDGDRLPDGVTVTYGSLTDGTGAPAANNITGGIGDQPFTAIALWTADSTCLAELQSWLDERWTATVASPTAVYAVIDSTADNATVENSLLDLNNKHISLLSQSRSPTPGYRWAASMAAACNRQAGLDPSQPIMGVELPGILPPARPDRYSRAQREQLLAAHYADWSVTADGRVVLMRVPTTYRTDSTGAEDLTWYDSERVQTAGYLRFDLVQYLSRFQGWKWADDGTPIAPGQRILTPSAMYLIVLPRVRLWQDAGHVERVDDLRDQIIVARSREDTERANIVLPIDIINGLRITAVDMRVQA